MAVVEDLSEDELCLLALMLDTSGIDMAEFLWKDDTTQDGLFRCYDFQYPWYRDRSKHQIDQAARSVGKSLGIQMRAFAFAFHSPGEEMLLTAPELIHLNPITKLVEDRILDSRVSTEMLKKRGASNGITQRPFEARFVNGSRIVGRIPQKDGKGVKGQHPKQLEQDEAQDYPEAGWVELGETLKYGNEDAIWRAHGVSKGVRDRFYKQTQPGSGWSVHRITAMHRGDWGKAERESKAELYGSRDHPDYRRNILGKHGDAQSALFVLTRLMACFIKGTQVQSPTGPVPIEEVKDGDRVLNALGTGTVLKAQESLRDQLVRVTLGNGSQFICTPEHPFLTAGGWRHADGLGVGDRLIAQREAVRVVRGDHHFIEGGKVLREELRRELAWGGAQQAAAEEEQALRMVRSEVLSPPAGDSLLWNDVRGEVARRPTQAASSRATMRGVRDGVRATSEDKSVLYGLVSGSMGEPEASPRSGSIGNPKERRASSSEGRTGWAPGASVPALEGAGGAASRMASAVLDEPPRGTRRRGVRDNRPGASGRPRGRRGGWSIASVLEDQGPSQGSVADVARVASVEVLQPGDPAFDRLSREDGDEGRVRVYDLTVSGHPSFTVGDEALLVHNCVDSVQSSDYNEHEYHHVRISDEKLKDSGLPIEALLKFPGRHKGYGVTWAGVDVGLTNDPSEILVFAETTKERSSKNPTPEDTTLKLITRIHLERISAPDHRRVMEETFEFYRCRGFAMDRTGLGLPIYQEIMQSGSAPFQNAMRAYNFSEKVLVGYEKAEDNDEQWWEFEEPEPIMANVLEYSSDMLRLLVDTSRIILPYDVNLIREFQGQTYQISKSSTNPYGRKVFSKGQYHALDAARMAAVAYFLEQVGEQDIPQLEPVMDSFVMA